MNALVQWFTKNLSPYISAKTVYSLLVSLMPILEVRGGLLAASLLKIPGGTGNSYLCHWKCVSYSLYSALHPQDF